MANFVDTFEALPLAQYSWRLDEADGALNCIDALGILDGVYHDNVQEFAPSGIWGIDHQVKFNSVDTSWIGPLNTVPYDATSTTSSWAVILNRKGQTSASTILDSTRNGINNFFQVQIRDDQTIMIFIRGDSNADELAYTTAGSYTVPDDEEVMIIVTRDNTTGWHIYVNNPNGDAIDVPLVSLVDTSSYDQSDWLHTNMPGNDRFQFGILRRNVFSGQFDGTMSYIGGVDDTITQSMANALNTAFYAEEPIPSTPGPLTGVIGTPVGNLPWWDIPIAPDITKPVLTLNGDAVHNQVVGGTFIDLGAEATDNIDPTITVYAPEVVDANTEGTYPLTYNHTDSSGNVADEIGRLVNITPATRNYYTPDGVNDKITIPVATLQTGDSVEFSILTNSAYNTNGHALVDTNSTPRIYCQKSSDKITFPTSQVRCYIDGVEATHNTTFFPQDGGVHKIKLVATTLGKIDIFSMNLVNTGASVYRIFDIDFQLQEGNRFYPVNDGWSANPVIADTISSQDGTAYNFQSGNWTNE